MAATNTRRQGKVWSLSRWPAANRMPPRWFPKAPQRIGRPGMDSRDKMSRVIGGPVNSKESPKKQSKRSFNMRHAFLS